MSDFTIPVCVITSIVKHPNADTLSIATVNGWDCIVKSDTFVVGDRVVYIRENSVVPDTLLETLGLAGKLKSNRVRALKLRGVVSVGLLLPANPEWEVGQDVATELGITKYVTPESVIPEGLRSRKTFGSAPTISYNFNNIKDHPHEIVEGQLVDLSEKIHGTNFQAVYHDGSWFVTSKGLGARHIAISLEDDTNTYVLSFRELREQLEAVVSKFEGYTVRFFGEVFGKIQDLSYGETRKLLFFDVQVSNRYLEREELEELGLPLVPSLYRGPFSKEVLAEVTAGRETVSGKSLHVREGVVLRTVPESLDFRFRRKIYKSVSADYLTRKGEQTEHE